jgi:hypothetical protein
MWPTCMGRNNSFCFGDSEGFVIWRGYGVLHIGCAYEAPHQGVALFNGDGSGLFHATRWELWEVV